MNGRRGGGRRGDGANLVVLEAVLIAILMLGSVLFVISYQAPTSDTSTIGDDIAVQARDGLIVLDRQTTPEAAYNENLLNKLVTEALHGDATALDVKFGKFLPDGAGYSIHLDNGFAAQTLVTVGTAPGEVVTGELAFAPEWTFVHLVPDFRVYPDDGSEDMNLTGLPMHRSQVVRDLEGGQVRINFTNGFTANLTDAAWGPPGLVANASIPSDAGGSGYPMSGATRVRANWTFRDTPFVGSAAYAVSSATVVATAHDPARTGLDASSVSVAVKDGNTGVVSATRNASIGDIARITYDLQPVKDQLDSADVTLVGSPDAVISVYAPVQGLAGEPTQWLLLERWHASDLQGVVEYDIPRSATYGAHVVVAELNYTLNGGGSGDVNQSARLVSYFNVGLPGGALPPNPLYRVVVAVWFDDW